MRTSLYTAAASILLLAGCNTPENTQAPVEADNEFAQPIVGGYAPADADDPFSRDAEAVAIKALYTAHPTRMIATVAKREVQVVAGLNHRFQIGLGGGKGAYKKMYEVVVYQKLDGTMDVTSIEEISLSQ